MDLDNNQESNAAYTQVGWNFIVLMSRQGKIRLSEFFHSYTESEKRRILRDIAGDILPRAPKMCNIIEKGTYKFVYRRYASLYFVVGVPLGMNELIVLEQIHLFVEALDGYFNSGACIRFVFHDVGSGCISRNCSASVLFASDVRASLPVLNRSSVRTRPCIFIAQVPLDFV